MTQYLSGTTTSVDAFETATLRLSIADRITTIVFDHEPTVGNVYLVWELGRQKRVRRLTTGGIATQDPPLWCSSTN